jgi:hypothetical protein
MNWKQIAAHFTGLSLPVFGVSWNPPKPEVQLAQRLVNFLEDRRVLYNPCEMEVPEHCIRSVVEIRLFLTELLGELPSRQGLPEHIRAMRAACRRFLDQLGDRFDGGRARRPEWGFGFALLGTALGELRATIGFHLGAIALMHGLSIDKGLAAILPPASREDDA